MFFLSLVVYMSSGLVLAIVIVRDQVILYWRELIGLINVLKVRQIYFDWYVYKFEFRCSLCYYVYYCYFKVGEYFC